MPQKEKIVFVDIGSSYTKIFFISLSTIKIVKHLPSRDSISISKKYFQYRWVVSSIYPSMPNLENLKGLEYTLLKKRDIPMKTLYSRQLGIDRLLNCFSSFSLIKKEVVVISMGTAITFDYVNNNGVHVGGFIFPNRYSMWKGLLMCTPLKLQPKLKNRSFHYSLAQSTSEAICRGITCLIIEGIKGLIRNFCKNKDGKVPVVITGGDSEYLYIHLRDLFQIRYEPYLPCYGIREIFLK